MRGGTTWPQHCCFQMRPGCKADPLAHRSISSSPHRLHSSNSTLTRDVPVPVNATTEQLDTIPLSAVQGFKEVAQPWYTDPILPFDIPIAAANEYGAAASAKLYGVEILNEGFGTSVDDSVLEQQAPFIARSISPLQAIGRLLREKEEGRNPRGHRCAEAKTALAREPVSRTWRLAE